MPQTVSLIAAVASNGVIGIRNTLPWRLPGDLRHFKRLTSGHPVIMGRKTFESLGRPLPERTNIILTRDDQFRPEGCLIAHDMASAIALCDRHSELFVIGGAQIYQQAMPFADRLYVTEIHRDIPDGDAWFPPVDSRVWREAERVAQRDEDNLTEYDFVIYQRIA